VGAVERGDFNVDHGVAGDDARLAGLADALVDSRDVLPRDRAARDAVDELVALAGLLRLELQPHMAVLPATARLAHELAFGLDGRADRLAVGDLRLADVRLDLELALHAIDDDLEVQLAHPRNDRLPGLLVRIDSERGIFL